MRSCWGLGRGLSAGLFRVLLEPLKSKLTKIGKCNAVRQDLSPRNLVRETLNKACY